jgi:hypothetical protein
MATLAQPIDAERTRRKGFSAVLLGYAAALIIGLVAMAAADAWRAGFSGADESAHFLNSWFIAAYAQQALGADPMGYAAEYYLHYPKISIGHWPPGYYGLLAPLFLLIPPTPAAAFAINLAVSALPSALIAIVLGRTHGRIAALVGAALLALTPIMLEAQAFFMVDAPLAAAVLAATILWSDYLERGGAWRVFAFAALATLAVLMKGNGWLLALMPPLHIAVTGRWAVLRSPALWLAALLAAAIVGPWYWLTAGISADGFNHEAGLAYAARRWPTMSGRCSRRPARLRCSPRSGSPQPGAAAPTSPGAGRCCPGWPLWSWPLCSFSRSCRSISTRATWRRPSRR